MLDRFHVLRHVRRLPAILLALAAGSAIAASADGLNKPLLPAAQIFAKVPGATTPEHVKNGHYEAGDRIHTAGVRFSYTPSGMRDSITDGHGVTLFNYNSQDRMTGVEFPNGEAIAYEYDKVGNLTKLITAYQEIVYTYDARNRLESVSDASGTTRYSYDQVGNRTGVRRPNGVNTTYSYGPRHRLDTLTHTNSSGAVLFGVTYEHDASGLRTSAVERDASGILRTINYEYDALKRLTAETIVARDTTQSRKTAWTYDKVGNRLTQTLTIGTLDVTTEYAYDANDRLLTERTGAQLVTYTYDPNGNTQSRTGPNGRTEYDYDRAQRLVEMRDGTQRINYTYDADGMRIGQTRYPAGGGAPVSTFYLLDKNRPYAQVIEEHEQVGSGPRRLSAIYTFGDDQIAQTRGAETRFILPDGMGSTRLVTDATGAVTDTIAFDAFGNELARTGTTELAHLYRGEQFDPNLAFYNMRARFYDPKAGRFPSMDSFTGFAMDPPSLHKYAFNHNDPINRFDPSGHFSLLEVATSQNIQAMVKVYNVGSFAVDLYAGGLAGGARAIAEEVVFGKFAKFRPVAKMSDKVFGLFAKVWSRGINLQLGKPYSANVLRHNMEQIFGELPPNHIPHHIVPKTSPAMTKLQQFGIDPNSPSNGVALPKNAAAGDYSSAHGGRHCKKYYDFVETVVMGANDKEEAINALAAIRQDLLSGALVVQGCE